MRLTFIEERPRIIPVNDVLSSLISLGGWIGAAELLVAYFLVSNCASSGAWPSVIANAFYLLVGINILFTVKRAYIAQLSRRQREELRARVHGFRRASPAVSAGFVEQA